MTDRLKDDYLAARFAYLTQRGRRLSEARRVSGAEDWSDDALLDGDVDKSAEGAGLHEDVGGAGGHEPWFDDDAADIAVRESASGLSLKPVVGGKSFTRSHVWVIAALCVVGAVVFVAFMLSGRARVAQVPLTQVVSPSPPVVTETAALSSASSQPAESTMIQVHVWGAVATPGVVKLRQGDRVADALAAAGGLLASADPADLNLAAPLIDGAQVAIGSRGSPLGEVRGTGGVNAPASGATSGAQAQAGLVDLNRADQATLEALPGIGPVTAAKILAWRDEHGRFTSIDELQEISGIGPKLFAQLKPLVGV